MGFFSTLFGKKEPPPSPPPAPDSGWPNHPAWSALRDQHTVIVEGEPRYLWTVECGEIYLPSGRLVACDPFVCLEPKRTAFVHAPKGRFPVIVTLADVSEKQDRSHIREAYASIIFSPGAEAYRKSLPLARDGEPRPDIKGDNFIGFTVDSGTACFIDETFASQFMPNPKTWHEELFDNPKPESWFSRMDDPAHLREGLANITLPLAKNGENIIIIHSGWGDGVYPVIGSFDQGGQLIAVHIDFMVV